VQRCGPTSPQSGIKIVCFNTFVVLTPERLMGAHHNSLVPAGVVVGLGLVVHHHRRRAAMRNSLRDRLRRRDVEVGVVCGRGRLWSEHSEGALEDKPEAENGLFDKLRNRKPFELDLEIPEDDQTPSTIWSSSRDCYKRPTNKRERMARGLCAVLVLLVCGVAGGIGVKKGELGISSPVREQEVRAGSDLLVKYEFDAGESGGSCSVLLLLNGRVERTVESCSSSLALSHDLLTLGENTLEVVLQGDATKTSPEHTIPFTVVAPRSWEELDAQQASSVASCQVKSE